MDMLNLNLVHIKNDSVSLKINLKILKMSFSVKKNIIYIYVICNNYYFKFPCIILKYLQQNK